ncbi:MAG: hypothetical protein ACLRXV_03055, partial [Clostridium sp.]
TDTYFYIDKLSIVTIEICTYFFILKFNKNEVDFKINSIIIQNIDYYVIYSTILIITVRKSG